MVCGCGLRLQHKRWKLEFPRKKFCTTSETCLSMVSVSCLNCVEHQAGEFTNALMDKVIWLKYFSAVTFYFVFGYKEGDYSWWSPVRIHARLIKKFLWRDMFFFHLLQLTNYFKNLTIFYLFSKHHLKLLNEGLS